MTPSDSTRRIMIAGGSGLIGRHLSGALLARDDEVLVLSRHPASVQARLPGCAVLCWHPGSDGRWQDELGVVNAVIDVSGARRRMMLTPRVTEIKRGGAHGRYAGAQSPTANGRRQMSLANYGIEMSSCPNSCCNRAISTTTTDRPHASAPRAQIIRRVTIIALLSVAIITLLLAVPGLQGVAGQISHMDASWLIAAVALELGSCAAFVVVFRLFFDELPADAACELAWTEQGAGALLPGGGVGAMAVGGWLLRRAGISKRQVIERSSALFFLTSAVNIAALLGAGALLVMGVLAGPRDLLLSGIPILGGLVATAAVLLVPVLMRRAPGRRRKIWLVDLVDGIDGARRSLLRPSWRLGGALGYLGLDIAALGATFAASGHPLPVAPLVLGYLIGYLANLIPIPGGFGVLEGGLAGALIAYGAPPTQAAAAVIVYHAIAFWIPSLGGLLGYSHLSRRLTPPDAAVSSDRRRAQPARLTPEPAY